MSRRTLATATLALLLASTAPPPALAADSPLPHPASTLRSAPAEIWSALRTFISFLGHGMDQNGSELSNSGLAMDPNGSGASDSDLGHTIDPDG